jgi:hypothetical protein
MKRGLSLLTYLTNPNFEEDLLHNIYDRFWYVPQYIILKITNPGNQYINLFENMLYSYIYRLENLAYPVSCFSVAES